MVVGRSPAFLYPLPSHTFGVRSKWRHGFLLSCSYTLMHTHRFSLCCIYYLYIHAYEAVCLCILVREPESSVRENSTRQATVYRVTFVVLVCGCAVLLALACVHTTQPRTTGSRVPCVCARYL